MHILIPDPSSKKPIHKKKPQKSRSEAFVNQITNKTFSQEEFLQLCLQDEVLQNLSLCQDSLSFLKTVGLDLHFENHQISLRSSLTPWHRQIFCFVDIESTDANPLNGHLLEIGAILCNGKGEVLGRFESLVQNTEIPPIIQEITGIAPEDTQDSPPLIEVLKSFRKFLGTSIFVAHNASFDYHFLDFLYHKHFGIGLYNQTLCTLKTAQKLIHAPRYSLSFLNEFLEIFTPISHRAYADAYTCKEVFLHCSKHFPPGSAQSLLNWIKSPLQAKR